MLPIVMDYRFVGKNGYLYMVDIEIYSINNSKLFPDGVKATFRLYMESMFNSRTLVYLMDNHEPYGYHEHANLPQNINVRTPLLVNNWKEAWNVFQKKCQEISCEI